MEVAHELWDILNNGPGGFGSRGIVASPLDDVTESGFASPTTSVSKAIEDVFHLKLF